MERRYGVTAMMKVVYMAMRTVWGQNWALWNWEFQGRKVWVSSKESRSFMAGNCEGRNRAKMGRNQSRLHVWILFTLFNENNWENVWWIQKKVVILYRQTGEMKRTEKRARCPLFRPPLTPPDSGGETSGRRRPDVARCKKPNTKRNKKGKFNYGKIWNSNGD